MVHCDENDVVVFMFSIWAQSLMVNREILHAANILMTDIVSGNEAKNVILSGNKLIAWVKSPRVLVNSFWPPNMCECNVNHLMTMLYNL